MICTSPQTPVSLANIYIVLNMWHLVAFQYYHNPNSDLLIMFLLPQPYIPKHCLYDPSVCCRCPGTRLRALRCQQLPPQTSGPRSWGSQFESSGPHTAHLWAPRPEAPRWVRRSEALRWVRRSEAPRWVQWSEAPQWVRRSEAPRWVQRPEALPA